MNKESIKKIKAAVLIFIVLGVFSFGFNAGQSYPHSPIDPPSVTETNITTDSITIPGWLDVEQINASWIKTPMAAEATFIVATSDSLNKEHANWICDGTDDEVEINAAVDATYGRGGIVQLLDGRYFLGDTIKLDNCVTLQGVGRGFPADTTPPVFATELHADFVNKPVVSSKNVLERHYAINIKNLRINNSDRTNAGSVGIEFRNVSSGTIEEVCIRYVETGINLSGRAYYNLIINSETTHTKTGINITGDGSPPTGNRANEVRIMCCKILTCSNIGINVDNGSNINIIANAIENIGNIGIRLNWINTQCFGNRIENSPVGYNFTSQARQCSVYAGFEYNVTTLFDLDPSSINHFTMDPTDNLTMHGQNIKIWNNRRYYLSGSSATYITYNYGQHRIEFWLEGTMRGYLNATGWQV